MATQPQGFTLNAKTKRKFDRHDGVPPLPIFINAAEIAQVGADVYFDGGVVSPEAVMEAQATAEGGQVTVEVQVVFRVAMSIATASVLHQRLTQLLKNAQTLAAQATRTQVPEKG